MRLKRVLVERFRVIERAEIELTPGLNLLHGPNDIGKSTFVSAVRAALLLQSNSSESAEFKPWVGDHTPHVVLEFQTPTGGLFRLEKEFGTSGKHSAKLELWRDGVGFEPDGAGRNVDGKLRELLEWGIQGPGGKNKVRGMPASFLVKALLGDQSGVDTLFADSLVDDTSDSGRLRLTTALQAFAQDPRFKSILAATQKKVDEFFAKEGAQRRGRHSPFYASSERIKELKAAIEELRSAEAASIAARRNYQELLAQVDVLSQAFEGARTQVAAEAALEQAQRELAVIDQRRSDVDLQVAKVGTLEASVNEFVLRAAAAVERVTESEAALAGAREHMRLSSSEAAEQERSTKLAELATAQANDDLQLSRYEAQVAAANAAISVQSEVSELEIRQRELEGERSRAQQRVERSRQSAEEAQALGRQLSGLLAYARWFDANAQAQEAGLARAEVNRLRREMGDANREAEAIRAEVNALGLPDVSVAKALVALEQDLALARAKLGGGLSLTVRGKDAAAVRIVIDGAGRSLAQPTGTSFEVQGTAQVGLGDLLEVEVSAGDAASRGAFDELQRSWRDQSMLLAKIGVGAARELLEKCEAAESRRQTAIERTKEAKRLGDEASRQEVAAASFESRTASAAAFAKQLEGLDVANIEKVYKSLEQGWERSTADEQARIGENLREANEAQTKSQLEVAAKTGELNRLNDDLAACRVRRDASVLRLGRSAQELLPELREATSALEIRKRAREAERARVEQSLTNAASDARRAVSLAEAALQEAIDVRARCQGVLERERSELDQARGQLVILQKDVGALDRGAAATRVEQVKAVLANLPVPKQPVSLAPLEELERELHAKQTERHKAEGAFTHTGGAVVEEQLKEFEAAHRRAEDEHRELEIDAAAWRLLRDALVASEGAGARHLGKVLGEQVGGRLEALTQRPYRELAIDPNLRTTSVRIDGADRDLSVLSVGTREQLATLLRLAIAESLGTAVVLDDHLVQTDPRRLEWFLNALQEAAKKIQVIVITCRPRDYEGATGLMSIDLEQRIKRWPSGVQQRTNVEVRANSSAVNGGTVAVRPVVAGTGVPVRVTTPAEVQKQPLQVAPQPAPPASPRVASEPWASLLSGALQEMALTPSQFAARVGVGTRVVELWLKGAATPAAQFRASVIRALKEGAASPDSSRSRAAAML
ncbi:MAG: AAA family ATPase [Myxococcaceae bacterium]